jgi:hypothetical protein
MSIIFVMSQRTFIPIYVKDTSSPIKFFREPMAVPVTHVNDPHGPLFRYLADVADNKEQLDLETGKGINF